MVRKFNTNTNVQGIKTYALHVSTMPRQYRTQKAVIVRRSEERASTAAALGTALASSRRSWTGDTKLRGLRAWNASNATMTAPTAKRQLIKTNVGMTNTEGCMQEPGHTLHSFCFDMAMCVNDATWKSLTRVCCGEDSDVQ
jgi:hypothetical protein